MSRRRRRRQSGALKYQGVLTCADNSTCCRFILSYEECGQIAKSTPDIDTGLKTPLKNYDAVTIWIDDDDAATTLAQFDGVKLKGH